MGVQALLPALKSITRRQSVSNYRGLSVAVDAYCWLHRGSYSCAREMVEGEPGGTDKMVAFCMSRVELLLRAGVTPYIVFDGGPLPGKGEEERSRASARQEHRQRATAAWASGNRTAAVDSYQKAVEITPAHAKGFIEALKLRGVAFVVAPYEADAQMAFLALNGAVDVVLTEDSDLLAYGVPRVLFKMDKDGWGEEVSLAELPLCRELSFAGWTHDLFQQMCALAGCDFIKSLPGIGIKKAHAHIRRTRDFRRAVRALRFDGVAVPPGYEEAVQRALWTFRHQRVYCPRRRATVPLSEPPGGTLAAQAAVPAAAELVGGEADFLGPELPPAVAEGIAEGHLDPVTFQPLLPPPPAAPRDSGSAPSSQEDARRAAAAAAAAAAADRSARPLTSFPGFLYTASEQARQQFKRPRRQEDPDVAPPLLPQQPAAAKPGPRAPPAAATSRFFSRAPAAAPAAAGALPLRAALWQALRSDDAPDDEPVERLGSGSPSQEDSDQLRPSQQSLGLGPWQPTAAGSQQQQRQQQQWEHPASPAAGAGAALGFVGGGDLGALQGVTPGFYQRDSLPPSGGGGPLSPPAARPRSHSPIADLTHLPGYRVEAEAALAALAGRVEERWAGGDENSGGRGGKAPATRPDFSKFAFGAK